MVEQELADTNETLSDQTCSNQAIQAAKMKIESEMGTLSADMDEMASEAGMSEEKAQRAMIDAARLADELRAEQECAQGLERERKLLEAQVRTSQARGAGRGTGRGAGRRARKPFQGREEPHHDEEGH